MRRRSESKQLIAFSSTRIRDNKVKKRGMTEQSKVCTKLAKAPTVAQEMYLGIGYRPLRNNTGVLTFHFRPTVQILISIL